CGSINARGRPWASKPLPIDYEQCCSDQLNPQGKADKLKGSRRVCFGHPAVLSNVARAILRARSHVCAILPERNPSAWVCERSVMTFVYRYYDQAELERQLNARATVPDITPILARYASESARMRACLPCRLSVSYGASEPERLDIFPVVTRGPAPIFVFLHG